MNLFAEKTESLLKKLDLNIAVNQLVHDEPLQNSFENELLFFIKPEVILSNKRSEILDLAFKALEADFSVSEIRILTSPYIKQKDIIARHYGVINQLSNHPGKYMSQEARENLERITNQKAQSYELTGSLEFLEKFSLDLDSYTQVIQGTEITKLAAGTYVQLISYENKNYAIINGFHPSQLLQYTTSGRAIITVRIRTNMKWSDARRVFLGATNPVDALENSLRGKMYKNRDHYGIDVSYSNNCFHMSAGPVEGLLEILRFNNQDRSDINVMNETVFGAMLYRTFSDDKVEYILNNPNLIIENKEYSVFDFTEEKDSSEALSMLKKNI